ncbi:MAG: hypothetical protein CSA36_06255 [Draconibacterium sp.]|nr:MAG: hypothetical protein CSA36_06255 [Draconibacterium sp.]
MVRKIIMLAVAMAFIIQAGAQRQQGSWQDYLSYAHGVKIAMAPDKVFCATSGGLMYYDIEDNSVNKFSAIARLSETGIKSIAYNSDNDVLVVVYNNSSIDLIKGEQVSNISDIKRKQITGDKTIHNISFLGNEAYLSCGFGIVVLNLEKNEIKDTYYIGSGGSSISINDVEWDNQYVYATTNNGILRAERSTNLSDFNNWVKIQNIAHVNEKFNHLVNFEGQIVANYTPDSWFEDELYILNDTQWQRFLPQVGYVADMQMNGGYLSIASREQLFVADESGNIVRHIDEYDMADEKVKPIRPLSVATGTDGIIWVADETNALVKITGDQFESGFLSSPLSNKVFSITPTASGFWLAPGIKKGWEVAYFQQFDDNEWDYFISKTHPELEGLFNMVEVIVDPADENHIFVASWGNGLLEYKNSEMINHYDNHNSPLETALPSEPDAPYVWVGGFDFDSEGNLWLSNSHSASVLKRLSPQGEWKSVVLPELANDKHIGQVLVTQSDDKWVVAPNGYDAYVVDKTGDRKKRLLVTAYFNNGQDEFFNRMNDIYSIAEDREGAIWIGTSKGVAVYTNPDRIWESDNFYAFQPSVDLNDGAFHPLLETEMVTAIAVNGANQKWLGTQNSGVYLVSENGDEQLEHFTTENSPLLSNNITSLAIDQESGEVFFGTSEGLISYMGKAIRGKNSYANVYVYPNPVRETYKGPVTVTGLKENTDVKITDISGNLVFHTTSLGGQAVWDGTNLNGNRVKTGVYLVLCNDKTGEETHISKLLFIH